MSLPDLTPAELRHIHEMVATDALAHLGMALGGKLSAEELAHKDFLVALADKLAVAVPSARRGMTARAVHTSREAPHAS